jgi:hypothetical protein
MHETGNFHHRVLVASQGVPQDNLACHHHVIYYQWQIN